MYQTAIFEITSNCNLKCLYCYNHWKSENTENTAALTGKYHKISWYKKIIKRLIKDGVRHIVFSGGEPLLLPYFSELLLYTKMKRADFSIISNGTAWSDELIDFVTAMQVLKISIPFHSMNPEIHDRMVAMTRSWQKANDTRLKLVNKNVPVVPVIVLTKLNCPTIIDTILCLIQQGHTEIMLNRFNIGGLGIENSTSLLPTINQLQDAYKTADSLARKFSIRIFSSVCTPACILEPRDYPHIKFTSCSVGSEFAPITIDVNGNFRACNHSPEVLGSIFKDDPRVKIREKYTAWKNHIPEECVDCEKYSNCLGGCRAASEQLHGSSKKVDPLISILT